MSEALVDLTGGIPQKHILQSKISKIEESEEWKLLLSSHKKGHLLGCSHSIKSPNNPISSAGIIENHAYGITEVRTEYSMNLLRIRNPWGMGVEWNGKFRDSDPLWDKYKLLKERLGHKEAEDGTWWMCYEDWRENYNRLYICELYSDNINTNQNTQNNPEQYIIKGKWEGKSMGGPPLSRIDRDEEKSDIHSKMDTDAKWFNNPQFRITLKGRLKLLVITLYQRDVRMLPINNSKLLAIDFQVLRGRGNGRIWELDKDDVVGKPREGKLGQREIVCKLRDLYSGKTPGSLLHLVVVPNVIGEGVGVAGGREFWVRIFASSHIEVVCLDETCEVGEADSWNEKTAGGKRLTLNGAHNPFWCTNPQYSLTLYRPTHVKVYIYIIIYIYIDYSVCTG